MGEEEERLQNIDTYLTSALVTVTVLCVSFPHQTSLKGADRVLQDENVATWLDTILPYLRYQEHHVHSQQEVPV